MKLIVPAILLSFGLQWAGAQEAEAPKQADAPAPAADPAQKRTPLTSIVRVNTTRQAYNLTRPWEKVSPDGRRGLGAVIEGGKVLVTAEIVANATYIELEMPESGEKASAETIAVDYEADLALLRPTADNADFLKDLLPLELADSIEIGDTLHAWQIERNGTPAETPLKISKAETASYFLRDYYFLTLEATGPLQYRAGSFTLPVVKDGRLAGLLLSYSSKEQVSNILPASIIRHFLHEQADGDYKGFATLGIRYSQTLDDQFRKYLNLGKEDGGVYITEVTKGSSADKGGIKQGDVVLEVSGHKIDSRGNYDDPVYGKLSMSHLVRGVPFVGDKVKFKIVREGERKEIEVPMIRRNPEDYLIDPYMFDRGPKFLVLGGMVFQELTVPYLQLYGDKWRSRAPIKFLKAMSDPAEFEEAGRQKLVVLTRTIPTPATLGYERINSLIVTKVNNRAINDIKDLAEAAKHPENGIHRIEFEEYPKLLFLDAGLTDMVNKQLEQRLGATSRLD